MQWRGSRAARLHYDGSRRLRGCFLFPRICLFYLRFETAHVHDLLVDGCNFAKIQIGGNTRWRPILALGTVSRLRRKLRLAAVIEPFSVTEYGVIKRSRDYRQHALSDVVF